MKKFLALLLLSVVLVAYAAPAFAGWNKPQSPVMKKCILLRHSSSTDWEIAPDKKSAEKTTMCQCDYQNWYGITNRYVGPSRNCPYCSHPEYF